MDNKTINLTEQFIRIANKWNGINEREIKIDDDFAVTTSEIHVISAVGENEKINVTRLAEILGVTKGAVSQMVDILTKKGMLQRGSAENNKKTVLLSLTEKGRKAANVHEQLHTSINRKVSEIFSVFSEREVERIGSVMEKIEEFLNESDRSEEEF